MNRCLGHSSHRRLCASRLYALVTSMFAYPCAGVSLSLCIHAGAECLNTPKIIIGTLTGKVFQRD